MSELSPFYFLAHLSRKLKDELIAYQSSCRVCVCACVCVSINILKLEISVTGGPIVTKFYVNHHLGRGKVALGFGPDRIGTLVSMATDSSHRVIMGKISSALLRLHFYRIFFILAGIKTIHNISDKFEIRPDRTKDCGVSSLERMKKVQ